MGSVVTKYLVVRLGINCVEFLKQVNARVKPDKTIVRTADITANFVVEFESSF